MIKVKDGYAKLIGTTTTGSASHLLLSNGGVKAVSDFVASSALDEYLPLTGGTLSGYTRIALLAEPYTLSKSKYSDYIPSGTIFHLIATENNVSSAALINIDTTHTNGDTNSIYFGGVNSGLSNGASNFVIGRRTGTSTWAESLRIDANGNVGIGTDTPPNRLTVAGGPILQQQKNTWLNTANLMLGRSDATVYTDIAVIGVTNGNLHLDSYSGYAMYFNHYVGSTAGLSKGAMLDASGQFGIGGTPSAKLHSHGLVKITANGKTLTIGSQNADHCHYSTDSPCHWFNKEVRVVGHVYGGTNYDRRLAYADELHSKDAGAIEGSITNSGAYSYSSTRYGIWYQNHYSGHGLGSYRGVLSCRDSGVGFELNSYWCVNPSDSANLNNLYFRVKRDAASDWGPYSRIVTQSFSGSIYADHFYEHSDATLKTNIKTINTSDNIPQLKSFDWKENGKHSYGLIAQELEEMGYVELVEESNGKKTVQYSAALSLIVGKLQVKIQEIEKENKELRDELNNLKNNKLWQS